MARQDQAQASRPTVALWRLRAAARLDSAGFAPGDSRRDIAVIARAVLGWDQGDWIVGQQSPLPESVGERLEALVARRATGEPIAYLTGEREFYGRPFAVNDSVLIPRPETELLVETASRLLGEISAARAQAITLLDVGTGSGCLAITLALEHPEIRVVATDVSPAALRTAAGNAARHGVAHRVTFVNAALTTDLHDAVQIIVSNPPYVAESDRATLPRDVRDFEPPTALFGGQDGLEVIRALIPAARRALIPGGWFCLEIGAGQAAAVQGLIADDGLIWIDTRPDLAGIPRVVVSRRPLASV